MAVYVWVVVVVSVLFATSNCLVSCDRLSRSELLWWQKRPLVYSNNRSATGLETLQGILPDILQTVANACDSSMKSKDTSTLTTITTNKVERLLKASFLEKIGPKDIALPVKLRQEKKHLLGMNFVKLLESPGIAVIIKKTVAGTELLKAILLAWPILIFVVLSALLSGFFIWFLEYRSNPQMFDPFCPKGVVNGFWFAAVTMTTVGYGDVTPKTLLGRLFTIIWISVGLVILAMYMGIVTASLTTTRLEVTEHFYGIAVAAVNRTDEEKFAILHNANVKVQDNELQVIDAVFRKKDGVKVGFLDFYLASYYSELLYDKKLDIVRVIPRKRAYGMMLGTNWSTELVNCLRQHTQDVSDVMHELVPKYITVKEHKQGLTEYFSGSVFGYSIYALLGVLFLLTTLGILYDRRFCKFAGNDDGMMEKQHDK